MNYCYARLSKALKVLMITIQVIFIEWKPPYNNDDDNNSSNARSNYRGNERNRECFRYLILDNQAENGKRFYQKLSTFCKNT